MAIAVRQVTGNTGCDASAFSNNGSTTTEPGTPPGHKTFIPLIVRPGGSGLQT